MINPINVAKSYFQFIYTNSLSAVKGIASSVNKCFNYTINKSIDAFKFTNKTMHSAGTFIYTNSPSAVKGIASSVNKYFNNTNSSKGDITNFTKDNALLEIEKELGSVENWDNHRRIALIDLKNFVSSHTNDQNSINLSTIIDKKIGSYKDDSSELIKNKKTALSRLKDRIETKVVV